MINSAAVFGIFSTAAGFVAFSLLLTATCFKLAPRRILACAIIFAVCFLLSILTLIAGAADVCKASSATALRHHVFSIDNQKFTF